MRRRLIAAGAAAAVSLLGVVLLVWGCNGGHAESPARVVEDPPGRAAGPLAARPPRLRVRLPRRKRGRGAFMTVSGRTVHLADAQDPSNLVALTFDDGPGGQTKAILRSLKRVDAKASFFVVGENVARRPGTVRALGAAGMTIGNHSWSHSALPRLSAREVRRELDRTQGMIEEVTGVAPRFFRPPGQWWNYVTAREVAAQGMVGVLFSIDTRDWKQETAGAIVRSVLEAKPGSVIAMHDAGGASRTLTVKAVGPAVRGLRRKGLEPVTLDELYGKSASGPFRNVGQGMARSGGRQARTQGAPIAVAYWGD